MLYAAEIVAPKPPPSLKLWRTRLAKAEAQRAASLQNHLLPAMSRRSGQESFQFRSIGQCCIVTICGNADCSHSASSDDCVAER